MSNYRSDAQQRDVEEGGGWRRLSGPLYAEIDALKRKVKRLEAERDRLRLKLDDALDLAESRRQEVGR